MSSLLPFLLLLTLTNAFDTSLISGTYTLSAGSCPSPLTISLNSTTLPSNSISLNSNLCNASLTLTSTPSNKTALQIFLSEAPQIPSFLTTSQNLTCANDTLHSLTVLSPTDQVTLPSALTPQLPAPSPVVLKKGFVFLFTRKCVFQRQIPGEDGLVQQILDTVTECLPGDALVTTPAGLTPVSQLRASDSIATTAGAQSVLAWTHRDPATTALFAQIRFVASNATLELTQGHYVFTDRGLIPAGSVRVGMVMESDTRYFVVRSVASVLKRGVYNPHTAAGDLLVGAERIRVSCYTSAVPPVVAHALLAPVRGVFRVHGVQVLVGKAAEALVDRIRYSGIVGWLSA